eukprot:5592350-Heterocapsa_arctica.AAC.1
MEVEEELSFMKARLEELASKAQVDSKAEWNLWATESFLKGAGRAHKFAKEAKPWKPTSVLMQDGIRSHCRSSQAVGPDGPDLGRDLASGAEG